LLLLLLLWVCVGNALALSKSTTVPSIASIDAAAPDCHRHPVAQGLVRAAVLEVADQFFLLGVDGNRRITGSDRCFYGGVDVLELCISVGVVGSLAGLAISLTAILLLAQQPAHQLLAHLEALPAQRLCNVLSRRNDLDSIIAFFWPL
jgi:hypothetical protein